MSKDQPVMDMQGLTNAVESANRLSVILEREFEALKKQSLDVFEKIQPEKTEVILALSKISTSPETKALAQGDYAHPDDSLWSEFLNVMATCKELHLRNEILINRKLDATKGALQALHSEGPTSSVEVYDRLGRLSRGRRKGGYEEV